MKALSLTTAGPVKSFIRNTALAACLLLVPVCRVQASTVLPPTIQEAFGASSVLLNAATTLTFTITNPAANVSDLVGVAFTDIIPTGISPLFGSSAFVACGGTGSVGGQVVNLAGGSVAINSKCAFSVTVIGTILGSYTDTTGVVSSTNGGTGNFATASIDVVQQNAVPIPGTIPLFATGLGALGLFGWRGKRKA
jgi:hypothetical protein